jgi:hypothetical protein
MQIVSVVVVMQLSLRIKLGRWVSTVRGLFIIDRQFRVGAALGCQLEYLPFRLVNDRKGPRFYFSPAGISFDSPLSRGALR